MNIHEFVIQLEKEIGSMKKGYVFGEELHKDHFEEGLSNMCFTIASYQIALNNKLYICPQDVDSPGMLEYVFGDQKDDTDYMDIVHFNLALLKSAKLAHMNRLFIDLQNSYGKQRILMTYITDELTEKKLIDHCQSYVNKNLISGSKTASHELFLVYAKTSWKNGLGDYKIIELL